MSAELGTQRRRAVCAPVTRGWVQEVFQRLGLTAEDLRVDRLLAEVHATGGDPLTLTRLFGISDTTAIRYCAELDAPTMSRPPLGQLTEQCQRHAGARCAGPE